MTLNSVTIRRIDNGYIIVWDYSFSTMRHYRPKISKTLLEDIKRSFEDC